MKIPLVVCLIGLFGCRTETKWALRIPAETRDCSRDCHGAPDDPVWRECIAACGGEVSQEWCDGTWSKPRSPVGCREAETTRVSVGHTIALVILLVVGGSVALGAVAANNSRP